MNEKDLVKTLIPGDLTRLFDDALIGAFREIELLREEIKQLKAEIKKLKLKVN